MTSVSAPLPQDRPLAVGVLGPGSLGLAVAGRIASSALPKVSVLLLARTAERADTLSQVGFAFREGDSPPRRMVVSCTGPMPVGANTIDVLIVAVKCPATREAADLHAFAVGPNTLVVTLQNGLGAGDILAERFGDRVALATTRMGAHLVPADPSAGMPAGVRLVSAGQTVIGPAAPRLSAHRDRLVEAFNAAGHPTETTDDIAPYLWRKLLINAAINAPAALCGLRNGEAADDPQAVAVMAEVLAEGLSVAAAEGVTGLFPDAEAALAETLSVARRTGGNICSTLADRLAGRPTEIDFINGALADRASRHGLSVPVNRTLARLVWASRRLPRDGDSVKSFPERDVAQRPGATPATG
jgi:2-dehydropantoate 2-reductase